MHTLELNLGGAEALPSDVLTSESCVRAIDRLGSHCYGNSDNDWNAEHTILITQIVVITSLCSLL